MSLFAESVPKCLKPILGEPDPRVKDWILLNSPIYMVIILSSYFIFLYLGRKIMEHRTAFQLRKPLIVYNFCQVIFSAYICKEVVVTAYLSKYKFSCSVIYDSDVELTMRMANAFWYFYLTKIMDLSDTVFFVLRKKKSQLTFLHLYHHSTMIVNWYLGILFLPGGQTFFSVTLNSFVHVIMYSYYMLSAFGPRMQKYLKWKKYLTQIQLIQFVFCIVHLFVGYFNNCDAPTWLTFFTITYLWTMVLLFINFYLKAYISKKPAKHLLGAGDKAD